MAPAPANPWLGRRVLSYAHQGGAWEAPSSTLFAVRRAIARLKAEGLVVTEQGRGAFVRPKPQVRLLLSGTSYRKHRGLGLPGFNAQVLEQGQAPEQQLREVAVVDSPADWPLALAGEGEQLACQG